MEKHSEIELKKLIQGGETNTIELKVAAPRATEMAGRLCGMANAQGGMVLIGIKDSTHEIVGVPDHRVGETLDVILRAVTNSIYRQLTGVSDRTAHRDLETLVGRGRLKATGQRAARRYMLA